MDEVDPAESRAELGNYKCSMYGVYTVVETSSVNMYVNLHYGVLRNHD